MLSEFLGLHLDAEFSTGGLMVGHERLLLGMFGSTLEPHRCNGDCANISHQRYNIRKGTRAQKLL
jgi:hypothetical protein